MPLSENTSAHVTWLCLAVGWFALLANIWPYIEPYHSSDNMFALYYLLICDNTLIYTISSCLTIGWSILLYYSSWSYVDLNYLPLFDHMLICTICLILTISWLVLLVCVWLYVSLYNICFYLTYITLLFSLTIRWLVLLQSRLIVRFYIFGVFSHLSNNVLTMYSKRILTFPSKILINLS